MDTVEVDIIQIEKLFDHGTMDYVVWLLLSKECNLFHKIENMIVKLQY